MMAAIAPVVAPVAVTVIVIIAPAAIVGIGIMSAVAAMASSLGAMAVRAVPAYADADPAMAAAMPSMPLRRCWRCRERGCGDHADYDSEFPDHAAPPGGKLPIWVYSWANRPAGIITGSAERVLNAGSGI